MTIGRRRHRCHLPRALLAMGRYPDFALADRVSRMRKASLSMAFTVSGRAWDSHPHSPWRPAPPCVVPDTAHLGHSCSFFNLSSRYGFVNADDYESFSDNGGTYESHSPIANDAAIVSRISGFHFPQMWLRFLIIYLLLLLSAISHDYLAPMNELDTLWAPHYNRLCSDISRRPNALASYQSNIYGRLCGNRCDSCAVPLL